MLAIDPVSRKSSLKELLADEEKLIADYERKIKDRERRREERRLAEEQEQANLFNKEPEASKPMQHHTEFEPVAVQSEEAMSSDEEAFYD